MEDEDLRNMWVSSFSMQLDLSMEAGYNDVPDAASAVIKSPFVDNADTFNMYSSSKSKLAKKGETENSDWKVLQDWGPCSLTCGGGTMTMQRQCQPLPGKPCASGTQTLSKPCNTQKCPTSVELSESKENRMIMKTIKFSNKPWRYERCIVLEEDFDLVMDNLKQFVNKPRIPHRIVVNNSTLTIFQNFDY